MSSPDRRPIRALPDEDMTRFLDQLRQLINDPAIEVVHAPGHSRPGAPPSRLKTDAFEAVEAAIKRHYNTITLPTMSTGATDSRFFRALGVPAFGVSGLFSDPTVDARAHGRDERMGIKSYYEGQEFLYRLTKALSANVVAQ